MPRSKKVQPKLEQSVVVAEQEEPLTARDPTPPHPPAASSAVSSSRMPLGTKDKNDPKGASPSSSLPPPKKRAAASSPTSRSRTPSGSGPAKKAGGGVRDETPPPGPQRPRTTPTRRNATSTYTSPVGTGGSSSTHRQRKEQELDRSPVHDNCLQCARIRHKAEGRTSPFGYTSVSGVPPLCPAHSLRMPGQPGYSPPTSHNYVSSPLGATLPSGDTLLHPPQPQRSAPRDEGPAAAAANNQCTFTITGQVPAPQLAFRPMNFFSGHSGITAAEGHAHTPTPARPSGSGGGSPICLPLTLNDPAILDRLARQQSQSLLQHTASNTPQSRPREVYHQPPQPQEGVVMRGGGKVRSRTVLLLQMVLGGALTVSRGMGIVILAAGTKVYHCVVARRWPTVEERHQLTKGILKLLIFCFLNTYVSVTMAFAFLLFSVW